MNLKDKQALNLCGPTWENLVSSHPLAVKSPDNRLYIILIFKAIVLTVYRLDWYSDPARNHLGAVVSIGVNPTFKVIFTCTEPPE